MTFIKTLFKRYSHYNKEHIGYQKNQANNLLTNRAERTRLLNEMNKMGSSEKFFRYYFGIGKRSKEVRQFRDYLKTTHDQLENSKDMIQKMETLLHKGKLTNTEPDELERLIAQ
jgi:glutaredoxin 2